MSTALPTSFAPSTGFIASQRVSEPLARVARAPGSAETGW